MEPLAVPTLTGRLVTMRPHTMTDLEAVYERCLDPDTRRFTTIPLEYTRADAEQYLTGLLEPRESVISWALEVEGQYAGTLDLRVLSHEAGAGDLGFVTHPAFRGRGVMTEAVGLAVSYAFDELGWQAVRWQAHVENVASAKAALRNGFPTPTYVPDLLVERDQVLDGVISTLRRGMPRTVG